MHKHIHTLQPGRHWPSISVSAGPAVLGCLFMMTPLSQALAETLAREGSVVTLGAVTVSGDPSGPLASRNILSSVDVVGADLLQQQPVQYSWELFNRVPG